jgi:EAL domain-containing protein (putative c-di-GMP-specific phosphodiesterase class I)
MTAAEMDSLSAHHRLAIVRLVHQVRDARSPTGDSLMSILDDLREMGVSADDIVHAVSRRRGDGDLGELVERVAGLAQVARDARTTEVDAEPVVASTARDVLYERILASGRCTDLLPEHLCEAVFDRDVMAAISMCHAGVRRVRVELRGASRTQLPRIAASGESLVVGLPELLLSTDPAAAALIARDIRAAGGLLAVTEFGRAGGQILSLCRLEPDYVELDSDVVRRAPTDPRLQAFIDGLCAMQVRIGGSVIATGVDDEKTRAAMVGLRVDGVAGHAVGPTRRFGLRAAREEVITA